MLRTRHSAEDALGPLRFADLYLASLKLNHPWNIIIPTFLLLSGRCKFRKNELLHFWEGWYDRRFGIIKIPQFEPCLCTYCAERAEDNHGEDDDFDSVQERHRHTRYSPKNARTRWVPISFSPRIVAAVETYLDEVGVFGMSERQLNNQLDKALEKSVFLSPDHLDWNGLRATGDTYWAFKQVPLKTRAEMGGHREAELGTYSGSSPLQMANILRKAMGMDPVDITYTDLLIGDPRRLANEPWDPLQVDPLENYNPLGEQRITNPRGDEENRPADIDIEPHEFATIAPEIPDISLREMKGFLNRFESAHQGDRKEARDFYVDFLNSERPDAVKLPGQATLLEAARLGLQQDGEDADEADNEESDRGNGQLFGATPVGAVVSRLQAELDSLAGPQPDPRTAADMAPPIALSVANILLLGLLFASVGIGLDPTTLSMRGEVPPTQAKAFGLALLVGTARVLWQERQ